jgi:hypothetical protein
VACVKTAQYFSAKRRQRGGHGMAVKIGVGGEGGISTMA